MRVHPLAELCVKLVDVDTITELNAQWMEGDGPTDVLAFPMDELRPGLVNEEPTEEGILGDIMVCPRWPQRQAARPASPVQAELELLTTHGILHLLGLRPRRAGASTRRCSGSRTSCSPSWRNARPAR